MCGAMDGALHVPSKLLRLPLRRRRRLAVTPSTSLPYRYTT